MRTGGRSSLIRLFTLALVLVALFPGASRGVPEIAPADPFPTRGEPVTLMLTDEGGGVSGAVFQATYRPESDVEQIELIGRSDTTGSLVWTPQAAGLVTLNAKWPGATGDTLQSSTTLSVRFGGFPLQGVIMMIIAGLVLFGGAGYSILRVMRQP